MKLHNAKKAHECARIEQLLDQLPVANHQVSTPNRYKVRFKIRHEYNRIFSRVVKAATPLDATEEIRILHGADLRVISVKEQN